MSTYINIEYDKQDGSIITERKIIPTNIPDDFISAIDVSSLNDKDIDNLIKSRLEYDQYAELFKKNMFKYSEWLEHTNQTEIKNNIKYRRFKINQTKFK
jgi:hypothetical protein